jgi:hypothetical protein
MGLSLCVGLLANRWRDQVERFPVPLRGKSSFLSAVRNFGLVGGDFRETQNVFNGLRDCLVFNGLSPHIEPIELPVESIFGCQMWSYRGLHQLRQFAAYTALSRELYSPVRTSGDEEDAVYAEYYRIVGNGDASELPYQHLALHSDSDGFYVPQDFERVLDTEPHWGKQLGWKIGSTIRLHQECLELASMLEIPLNLDIESMEVWNAPEQAGNGGEKWTHFGVESYSCLRLIRACEHSEKTGAAIAFC